MAQEDYLSGSQFGQVAGTLLSRKKKDEKDELYKALLLSAITESFGQLQKQQKQDVVDAAADVKVKYADIFDNNKEEWNGARENRDRLKKYDQLGESYLNQEVAKRIDSNPEFFDNDISWGNRANYGPAERKLLQDVFDAEKNRLKVELDLLRKDPTNTYETFTKYNEAAKNEYLAALASVEDDPTKKGLLRSAFNRIFRTKRDEEGNLVSTNAEKIELMDNLNKAQKERNDFRSKINTAKTLLDLNYEAGINNTQEQLLNGAAIKSQKRFNYEDVLQQRNNNLKVLQTKEGKVNKDFFNLPFNVEIIDAKETISNLNTIPEKIEGNTVSVNIKAEQFKNIKTLSKEGEDTIVNPISSDIFQNALAVQILSMNYNLLKNNEQPLVGAESIHAALQIWSDEGRFVKMNQIDTEGFKILGKTVPYTAEQLWNEDDILFIPPGSDFLIRGKSTSSDAASVNADKGQEKPEKEDETEFNPIKIETWAESNKFTSLNPIQRQETINELKRNYPDDVEKIDLIFEPILQNLQMQEKKKVNQTSQDVQMPQMSQDDVDAYIDEQRSKIASRGMEEVKELYNTKQMQFDMERLEKLAQGSSYVRGKSALLKKYNLDQNATPEEIEIVLATLKGEDVSLLAKQ